MTLVDVPHRRLEPERTQRANAADAEHGFLLLPQLVAAAVERACDQPILGDVLRHVRIQQEDRHTPHRRLPDAHGDVALEPGTRDPHLAAVGVQRGRQRRAAWVDRRVVRYLLAAAVDALVEIAVPIQQAHGDERQIQIAGRLAVVAREHAQAARVDRKALVPAILGAEVRDEVALLEPVAKCGRAAEVVVERRQDASILVDEALVRRRMVEDALIDGAQEQARAPFDLAPERGIELAEELPERRVPAEPEILREIVEPLQRGWDARRNL